ncbi:MAG: hypothetical protein ACJAZ2_002205 [Glaciecola sp.]|jgi:hypothetical protein
MKFTIALITVILLSSNAAFAGLKEAKHKMEVVPFKFSLNGGVYRSRLANAIPAKREYNNPAFFVQVFLPFKRSVDLPEHFDGNDSTSVYYDRLFSASPYAVFHVTEDMGNAAGIGQELSVRVVKRVYAKIQIAIAWTESQAATNDGLKTGFNFHNYWYLSTFLSRNTALSVGYTHISNGRVFRPSDSSIFDMLTVGVSHTFRK